MLSVTIIVPLFLLLPLTIYSFFLPLASPSPLPLFLPPLSLFAYSHGQININCFLISRDMCYNTLLHYSLEIHKPILHVGTGNKVFA